MRQSASRPDGRFVKWESRKCHEISLAKGKAAPDKRQDIKKREGQREIARALYTSPTIDAAELALLELEETWGKKYPMSVASWKANWVLLTAFYKYPVEMRKTIYTTNAIEGLNAQLRKNTSNRKVFPNDEAVIKILFLNIENFTKKWTKRQGWDMLMNQLSIMFPERLNPAMIGEL